MKCLTCGANIPNGRKYCGSQYVIGSCSQKAKREYASMKQYHKEKGYQPRPKKEYTPIEVQEGPTPRMLKLAMIERYNRKAASYMYVRRESN